jgi:hypothetical protein
MRFRMSGSISRGSNGTRFVWRFVMAAGLAQRHERDRGVGIDRGRVEHAAVEAEVCGCYAQVRDRRADADHHLAVVRIRDRQPPRVIGGDLDAGVDDAKRPRLGVVAGGREEGVAQQELFLLCRHFDLVELGLVDEIGMHARIVGTHALSSCATVAAIGRKVPG